MTDDVPVNDRRAMITASAGQTVFTFDFPIENTGDVRAYTNGVEDVSGFTVDVEAKTLTFSVGKSDGDSVVIEGDTPVRRPDALALRGGLKSSVLNNDARRQFRILQELDRQIGRQLVFNPDESGADNTLPLLEASKLLGVNSAGTAFELVSFADLTLAFDTVLSGLASGDFIQYNGSEWVNKTVAEVKTALGISAFAETLLDDASAGAVRTTLGLGGLAVLGTINNDNWSGADLAVANGGTGASSASAARSNLGVYSTGEVDALHFGAWANVATTSGTAVAIDEAIPSGTTEIELWVDGISVNGAAQVIFQIGDSGGYETTGYTSVSAITTDGNLNVAETASAGFLIFDSAQVVDAMLMTGPIRFRLIDAASNKWVMDGLIMRTNVANEGGGPCSGSKSLSAELDRIRITTVAGTAAFDAGSIRIRYR